MTHEPPIALRQATLADLPTLVELKSLVAGKTARDAGWLDTVLPDLVADAGPFSHSSYVLAIVGGLVAGAVCLNWVKAQLADGDGMGDPDRTVQDDLIRRLPPSLFISDMAVFADFRRRGVARLLLAAMERLAAELGVKRAMVVSDPGIIKAGHTGRCVELLNAAGVTTLVFDGV
ncbi:MAG: GNAT family N-acetyltransferase, partial [Beijerinckiaceae bacterium]|nr:GNAT family N-acetyltransferase [Beijerinckiaceae bacterium]